MPHVPVTPAHRILIEFGSIVTLELAGTFSSLTLVFRLLIGKLARFFFKLILPNSNHVIIVFVNSVKFGNAATIATFSSVATFDVACIVKSWNSTELVASLTFFKEVCL